jgi:ribosomal protein L37AE/L43A
MGLIFTVIGAFCMFGYSELFLQQKMAFVDANMQMTYGEIPAVYGGSWFYATYSMLFSTYYVNMSIFLAYAATYPDMQVLIMFIIPVKVKYLGIIYSIILVLEAFGMGIMGLFVIGASLLNFVVFFIMTRKSLRISPKMRARQRDFKKRTAAAAQARQVAKHKCAICGRTAEEYPNLEFRFCSKCEGNYEFCQDHLFTHKHFKRSDK